MCSLTAAALGLSAVGMMGQGISANSQAKYQAAEMENQAKVARWQAEQSLEQARKEQVAHDKQAAQVQGELAANQAASGLRMDSGSLLDASASNASEAAIDRQNIKYQGDVNSWGYNNQANSLLASASNSRQAGKNALITGAISGAGSLVGAGGSIYDSFKTGSAAGLGAIKAGASLLSSGASSSSALKKTNSLLTVKKG